MMISWLNRLYFLHSLNRCIEVELNKYFLQNTQEKIPRKKPLERDNSPTLLWETLNAIHIRSCHSLPNDQRVRFPLSPPAGYKAHTQC